MKIQTIYPILIAVVVLMFGAGSAVAAEPNMNQYQAFPLQTTSAVTPNIMVILDNSGSMNNLAYENQIYSGEPYNNLNGIIITSRPDDAEEGFSAGTDPNLSGWTLNLGQNWVGLRFPEVNIPQGATILSATIELVALGNINGTSDLLIDGIKQNNASPFPDDTDDYFKSVVPVTTENMVWTPGDWTDQQRYNSPDITAIIQEIVNQGGWTSGNAMAFRIGGTGIHNAYSRDRSSSRAPVLRIVAENSGKNYYGYFNYDYFYRFDPALEYFVPAYKKIEYDINNLNWKVEDLTGTAQVLNDSDIATDPADPSPSKGLWDGNWLNWCTMRRLDVMRKVLVGGEVLDMDGNSGVSARDGSGTQRNVAVSQDTWWEDQQFDSGGAGPAVSPYDGDYDYNVWQGTIVVDGDTIPIDVKKSVDIDKDDFFDGNLAGIVQRVGEGARWGNIWFNSGPTGANGGTVENTVGVDLGQLVADLESKPGTTWTPLAESFYVAMQYFRQMNIETGGYPGDAVSDALGIGTSKDPYWDTESQDFIGCAKSFVIMLTDGASTQDGSIPSAYKNYDGDNHWADDCTECGSNALDDVALWAHTNDLRPEPDTNPRYLPDDQVITLYTVYAFDDDPTARSLLMDAARNGGFNDQNNDGIPNGDYTDPADQRVEWDKDDDGIPDTYFEASDGFELENQMLRTIMSILQQSSSGTAASVLSTNAEGEGNSVQASYRPIVFEENGTADARWLGYLQNLWIDDYGNLREDSYVHSAAGDKYHLDAVNSNPTSTAEDVDQIVEFVNDGDSIFLRRYTKHFRYHPDNTEHEECILPNATDCNLVFEEDDLNTLEPIFEVSKRLAARDPNERYIFTFIDENQDGIPSATDIVQFDLSNKDSIKPYLGVRDNTAWGDNGERLGSDHDTRAENIITWIRGTDVDGLRNRTLDGVTWRLGDIIHSTPMTIAEPEERFDLLYMDKSYREFFLANKYRETMIYVGANDGMLHAFTSWDYKKNDGLDEISNYQKPAGASAGEEIGEEVWAYVPQNLLPHLKWTAMQGYTHTYYMDVKPRVFDARIDGEWRTILVAGMGLGGKPIDVYDDFGGAALETRSFAPSYVCMDITEPRNPKLLWERSFENLGFTNTEVAPVRVGESDDPEKWYLAFGSGPTEYDGTSTQGSYIYVVDLKTGQPFTSGGKDWLFGPLDSTSSFNSALAVDVNLNYNVDAIYLANNISTDQSRIYRVGVKCDPCAWDPTFNPATDEAEYDQDPANWVARPIFDANGHVSKKVTAALGTKTPFHTWVTFGTGRFVSLDDKLSEDQNYVYSIQDPYFNKNHIDYLDISGPTIPLTQNDLFESNAFLVTENEEVLEDGSDFAPAPKYGDFVNYVRDNFDGWYYNLENLGGPSERIISRGTIFGRYLWIPSFIPNNNICQYGGTTQFYGFYYETGTNAPKQVFSSPGVKYPTSVLGPPPPSIGVHIGKEGGGQIILQQGTGLVITLDISGFYKIRSGVADWWNEVR